MNDRQALLSGVVDDAGYPYPLGPYLLLASLGRGGMGAVHLAKHGNVAGIEKYCVIKTLKRTFTMDDEYILRFVDEARLVVHLTHRNICPVFDVGRVKDRYFIAMEMVTGTDVHTLMERARAQGSRLPDDLALHITTEVLEGLGYAHRLQHPVTGDALNLVHRDVSPQNVLVSFEGEVKLIDFGVAASSQQAQKTDPNIVMGKAAYMSREHLTGDAVDGRHDLFSAAVMLYEMLTGFTYYEDMNQMAVLDAISTGNYVAPRMGSIEVGLRPILQRALMQDRDQRIANCEDFKDELVRYMVQKQMAPSTRSLRAVVQQLCPGEQEAIRARIASFRDLKPPLAKAEQSSPGIPVVVEPASRAAPAAFSPSGGLDFSEIEAVPEHGAVHIAVNPESEHSEVLDFSLVPDSDAIFRPDGDTGEVPVQAAVEPEGADNVRWSAGPAKPSNPIDERTEQTQRIQRAPGKAPKPNYEETMVLPRAPGKRAKADASRRWIGVAVAIVFAWMLLGLLLWIVFAGDAPSGEMEAPAALPPPPVATVAAPPAQPAPSDPLADRVGWLRENCDKACSGRVQAAWENKRSRRGKRGKKLAAEANACLVECAP